MKLFVNALKIVHYIKQFVNMDQNIFILKKLNKQIIQKSVKFIGLKYMVHLNMVIMLQLVAMGNDIVIMI